MIPDSNDIDINWVEEKPDIPNNDISEKKLYPSPILGHYVSIYDELVEKCNPQNYATGFNYNYEKLKVANDLYGDIIEAGKDNQPKLKELRKKAVEKLGISISTEDLYNILLKQTVPDRFMQPYNKALVDLANEYHQKVLLSADNIEELENIQMDINKNSAFDLPKEKDENDDVYVIIAFALSIVAVMTVVCLVLIFIVEK